ncbi:hypothetical protein GCM10008170_24590 [Methylopila capsulata]|uniref:Uncharacterized protein n=1 Tax=Methylopila capsulata TaxID=61654 RepID=A0A9W6MS59_9HYPH|nr:hypothetical protein GCM10008170_24590 [Methylopila capsulata]
MMRGDRSLSDDFAAAGAGIPPHAKRGEGGPWRSQGSGGAFGVERNAAPTPPDPAVAGPPSPVPGEGFPRFILNTLPAHRSAAAGMTPTVAFYPLMTFPRAQAPGKTASLTQGEAE